MVLCRALVRNPRVLVLHENPGALDGKSKKAVADAMTTAVRNMNLVVLIVTHWFGSL